jgi:hypothetical protein
MSASIRITLPIAPGAKTCEGCDRYNDNDHCGDWCEPFKKRLPISGVRLPECLASERGELAEYWELRYDEQNVAPFPTRKAAFKHRATIAKLWGLNGKVIHVTRYRRRT